MVDHARAGEEAGDWTVTGIWSHFACSDEPDHPANDAQEKVFLDALDVGERGRAPTRGASPGQLGGSDPASLVPVRPGPLRDRVLRPGPRAGRDSRHRPGPGHDRRRRAVAGEADPAGAGVSYGHTWIADHDTTVGLVPVGYGDGVPRHAGNVAEVWLAGRRRPVRGRICMDQFVVDLDGELPDPGAAVVLFGTGFGGEPTATEWAQACGTINYEIVTRIGGRMVRRYVDEGATR